MCSLCPVKEHVWLSWATAAAPRAAELHGVVAVWRGSRTGPAVCGCVGGRGGSAAGGSPKTKMHCKSQHFLL